ncbi:MAG: polyprenyl diphosphate synthase [Candidatus Korarchaeum sp.]
MGLLRLLYRVASFLGMPFYRSYLSSVVKEGPIPRHVALILDGNRRFAIKRGLSWLEGYRMGAERTEELLEWLLELGVEHVTLYAFSTENFRRPREQVEAIFRVLEEKISQLKERTDFLREKGVSFRVVGRKEMLPESLRNLASEVEELTSGFDKTLNLALAYGGRAEIVDAVRKIAKKVRSGELDPESIDDETIRMHLYAPDLPDPDLIIRTSGEERLSNFLLWQSAYSELYFCEVYLPEMRKVDLLRAIRDYQRRKRRFGS